MQELAVKWDKFLMDVVKGSDISMSDFCGDSFVEEFFYFERINVQTPTSYDYQRMNELCCNLSQEQLKKAWERAMTNHYETSFIEDYTEAIRERIQTVVEESFQNLTEFFFEDLLEYGMKVEDIVPFQVEVDWDANQLTILGNLNILELILIIILSGMGCRYESAEEFREINSKNQEQVLLTHLHCLGNIEEIYASDYRFFLVDELAELDKIYCFGDGDVTDEELLDALKEVA